MKSKRTNRCSREKKKAGQVKKVPLNKNEKAPKSFQGSAFHHILLRYQIHRSINNETYIRPKKI